VLLVYGLIRMYSHLIFMQDGAPGNSVAYTLEELRERGIHPMFWPSLSPDLNPIEAVWNKMRDWMEAHHPDLPASKQRSYCKRLSL
jgi:transposase